MSTNNSDPRVLARNLAAAFERADANFSGPIVRRSGWYAWADTQVLVSTSLVGMMHDDRVLPEDPELLERLENLPESDPDFVIQPSFIKQLGELL